MKYYLSTTAQDVLPEQTLFIKEKKPRRASINQSFVVAQPEEEEVTRLNALACQRPFCCTHKARMFDTL